MRFDALFGERMEAARWGFGGAGMKARVLFYVQAIILVVLIMTGMSERYPWLTWAQALIPLAAPMGLANMVLPVVIFDLARSEQISPVRLILAILLSVAMTVGSFFALLPLVM